MIHIGIIGLGAIGQRLIKQFANHPEVKIVAVCDRLESLAIETADTLGEIRVYTDYQQLIADEHTDLIYVAVPPKFHHQIVMDVLKAKKHVLCEKPAALTVIEAKEMIEVCRKNSVMFMEGFMYQFHPQHKRVKEIIASGEIGEVKMMRASLSFFLEDQIGNIRMNQKLGGGSIYDVGCYCIHSIRNILDTEPKRVFASAQNDISNEVDICCIPISFPSNNSIIVTLVSSERTRKASCTDKLVNF